MIESDLDDLAALDEVAEEDGEADDAHAGEAPAPDDLSIHLPETSSASKSSIRVPSEDS